MYGFLGVLIHRLNTFWLCVYLINVYKGNTRGPRVLLALLRKGVQFGKYV